ncbi:ABC transporter ATP-binding protein [Patescibacteria group bacterium]|nr:ABC transporter ATP-binding protein [Patescibacteria group bacterium]
MTNKLPLIRLTDISKHYCTDELVLTKALRGVSLEIKSGEFIAIMGPSGSGKSTLMHILGFLDIPTHGKYKFEGKSVHNLGQDELAEIRNKKVGFVFQAFNLLPRTSALENVKIPMIYAGVSSKDQETRATAALKAVGLEKWMENHPNQLSGGQQQRVAIARALINKPQVIFADEPTGNLDSKSGREIMQIFKKLNEDGNTVIIVTHEKNIAAYAKRILLLKDGLIHKDHRQ